MATKEQRSTVDKGVAFFQGAISLSVYTMNVNAACTTFSVTYCCTPETLFRIKSLFLGLPPITDWDTILWPSWEAPPNWLPLCKRWFLNLKPKVVWNPDSIFCLSECHKAPDFRWFRLEVILKALVCLLKSTSPTKISPSRLLKFL